MLQLLATTHILSGRGRGRHWLTSIGVMVSIATGLPAAVAIGLSASPIQNSSTPQKWRVDSDSVRRGAVVAWVDAEDEIPSDRWARASLIVECSDGRTSVGVNTQTGLPVGQERAQVVVRFNQNPPEKDLWSVYEQTLSVLESDSDELSIRMASKIAFSERMQVSFTRYEPLFGMLVPARVEFDMRGGFEPIGQIGKACGWWPFQDEPK